MNTQLKENLVPNYEPEYLPIFDHKFKTRNDDEVTIVKAVEDASRILSKLCKVHGVKVRIERMNGWASSDARHAGKWTPRYRQVKVNIRNLYGASLSTIIEVLSHEFRHAVQTVHGVTDHDVPDSIKPTYISERYWNNPREKDARKYQVIYRDFVFNEDGFNYDECLATGDKVQVPLHKESKIASGYTEEDKLIRLWKKKGDTCEYVVSLADFNERFKKKYQRWTPASKRFWSANRKEAESLKREWVQVTRDATIDDLVC